MGGYGARSNKVKGTHYTDTKGFKVRDTNAIEVAEYYVKQGKYVAFLHEGEHRRADLSVEGHHVEVKGLTTLAPIQLKRILEKPFNKFTEIGNVILRKLGEKARSYSCLDTILRFQERLS